MPKSSFDVFTPDGSSITAEYAGAQWELFLISPDGDERESIGRKLGTRDELMIHCEKLAKCLTD